MEKGIKETKEILAAFEVIAVAVKKVMKDGKVDLADAAVLVELGAAFPVLAAAFEGIKEIPAEVKEIRVEEALELVGQLYAIAAKIQAA